MHFIKFSDRKVDSNNVFLFHKTTNRKFYDDEYKIAKKEGLYDVIFRNEKGQVTEGAISNIFIKKGNRYYTPPVENGLLNGVYRRFLLFQKSKDIKEKILYPNDIEEADEIFLTNAVRGIVKVSILGMESCRPGIGRKPVMLSVSEASGI
jgi:para-aminobenzoate synthetase/4-amino-4-deoxychorismate lyase